MTNKEPTDLSDIKRKRGVQERASETIKVRPTTFRSIFNYQARRGLPDRDAAIAEAIAKAELYDKEHKEPSRRGRPKKQQINDTE